MAYEKRVCVLKQIKKGFSADGSALTGAVYCERLGSELTVTPRISGLAPVKEGRYALTVWAGGRTYFFELKGNEPLRIQDASSVKEGFSVLVCFVRGDAEPVAFGYCGGAPSAHTVLLEAMKTTAAEDKKRKRTAVNPLPPDLAPGNPAVPPAVPVPIPDEEESARSAASFRERGYDDEAIAASDYYGNENEETAAGGEGERAQETHGENAGANDGAVHPFAFPRGSLTYYNGVKDRLEQAFARYPRDERLKTAFPLSEWVNSDGALLGIVYGDGKPRYLCVAVEAAGDPPEEIRENCVFVPETPFTEEKGFYVVFQDADTGEYVKTELS